MVEKLKAGEGTAGLILTDTLMRQSLVRSLQSIEQGTARFNENMEALKSNFLFRRCFQKQKTKTLPTDTKETVLPADK